MYSLINRVILLSHPEFHKSIFDFIINVFLDNGYPLDLIFSSIRRRLQIKSHLNSQKCNEQKEVPSHSYFIIPYVSCISKKFMQLFKNNSFCKLVFSCYNKLSKFIKIHKDALPSSSRSNVVYKINCLDCDTSYIDQTKCTLNTRVSEHRNHVRRNITQNSVITDNRSNFRHELDWDNVKILDEEMNYNKRLISEMIFIIKQKHGLNAQIDTALLDPIYNDLLC